MTMPLAWCRRGVLSAAMALACAGAWAAVAGPLRITVLEGHATVLDGHRRERGVPGLPLGDQSIVETDAGTRLLRIESGSGQALDLGPDTRVMLGAPGFVRRDRETPDVYLLQGWLKVSGNDAASTIGVLTRAYELPPFRGVAVTQVGPADTWLFIESGRASLLERGAREAPPLDAARGAFYVRSRAAAGTLAARATSTELQRVPGAFRDTLPLRLASVKALAIERRPLSAPRYAELQPWLVAETAVRSGFVSRFRPLLDDRNFRGDLDAHLDDHAEWRQLLHPPPPHRPRKVPVKRAPFTPPPPASVANRP